LRLSLASRTLIEITVEDSAVFILLAPVEYDMVLVGKQRAGTVSGTVEVIQRQVAGRGQRPNEWEEDVKRETLNAGKWNPSTVLPEAALVEPGRGIAEEDPGPAHVGVGRRSLGVGGRLAERHALAQALHQGLVHGHL
jgi:hypothetical protein